MPLFKIDIPANVGMFFGYIIAIASFDLIPIDDYIDQYGGLTAVDPINDNFEAIGFKSLYVLINLGTMLIFILLFPILVLLERVLRSIKCKCS